MAEEQINDPISDGDDYPEIEVNDDGSVDVIGDYQPDPETEPETEPIPEGDTPEPEDEPDEPHPYQKTFDDLELSKYGYKDVSDLLNRVPDLMRWGNENARRIAEIERRQEEVEPPSADEFYDNPIEAIQRATDQRFREIDNKFQMMEVQTFINSKPDFAQMEPLMVQEVSKYPGIRNLPMREAYELLYNSVKARQIPDIVKDTSQKAKAKPVDSTQAKTTVGKPDKGSPIKTMADWVNMSTADIEKEIGTTKD